MKKKEHVEDVDAAAAADDADLSSAARKALLQAVEGTHNDEDEALHSPRRFLSLFVSSNCSTSLRPGLSLRVQKQILYETIADLHKATARRFFGALQSLVRAATQPKAVETDAQAQDALFYAATAVQAYVRGQAASTHNTHSNNNTHSSNKRILLIEEVGVVAQFLHDVIFDLDHAPEAQTAIVAMCEAFWKANITGRENLVPQAIPQLVYSAATVTEETMFKKDMTRLYNIREALTIIDFADVSSDEVRRSLLSLASSPLCLKHAEGIKLLAFILQCDDETLQKDMHLAIRAQMTQQKKNMVRVYGEVYLKAWKLALDSEEEEEESQSSHTNSARMHVEEMMEQYAYSMIHAKHTTLNKSLSIFMEPFYQQQKTPAVEDLLHRIYGPILWRATAAANSQVRVNAVKVLAQVFPLQDASHNHTEQAVRQACTALTTLLKDDQPAVRMAAAEAVGKVMTEFWDVLPPATIRSFLNCKYTI
jgi:condensin-2 complex subunit G2